AVLVGDRAGDDVDLVDVGDRDHHRRVPDAGGLERPRGRAVGLDRPDPERLADPADDLGMPLDDDDLVCLVREPLGDVVADLAGADHDDPHGPPPAVAAHGSTAGSWYSGQRAAY